MPCIRKQERAAEDCIVRVNLRINRINITVSKRLRKTVKDIVMGGALKLFHSVSSLWTKKLVKK